MSPKDHDLDLIILAGGRGTRMGGTLKPLLRGPSGRPLLAQLLATLPGRRAWVVAPQVLHRRLAAATADWGGRTRGVADPGTGPADAVLCAARASGADRLFVAGGDHVHPARELAERLLEASRGYDGAWVEYEGRLQPLMVLVKRGPLLKAAGAQPPRALYKLFSRLSMHVLSGQELTLRERQGLMDVDTWEDARRAGLNPASTPKWPRRGYPTSAGPDD